jgi:hypothetical protein
MRSLYRWRQRDMKKIDAEIMNINKVICRNIDKFDVSDRGLLSQNILIQVTAFGEAYTETI